MDTQMVPLVHFVQAACKYYERPIRYQPLYQRCLTGELPSTRTDGKHIMISLQEIPRLRQLMKLDSKPRMALPANGHGARRTREAA